MPCRTLKRPCSAEEPAYNLQIPGTLSRFSNMPSTTPSRSPEDIHQALDLSAFPQKKKRNSTTLKLFVKKERHWNNSNCDPRRSTMILSVHHPTWLTWLTRYVPWQPSAASMSTPSCRNWTLSAGQKISNLRVNRCGLKFVIAHSNCFFPLRCELPFHCYVLCS